MALNSNLSLKAQQDMELVDKAKKGDHIDMVANMDCLIALSACPTCGNTPSNDWVNKPLKIEIWE